MTLAFLGGLGELLASRIVLHVIAVVASALWGSSWFRKWRRDKLNKAEAELFEFARAAVQETYAGYVEEIKLITNANGKLTGAERREARERAGYALERLACGKAAELLRDLTLAEREVLIEDAVSSMKRN